MAFLLCLSSHGNSLGHGPRITERPHFPRMVDRVSFPVAPSDIGGKTTREEQRWENVAAFSVGTHSFMGGMTYGFSSTLSVSSRSFFSISSSLSMYGITQSSSSSSSSVSSSSFTRTSRLLMPFFALEAAVFCPAFLSLALLDGPFPLG